MRSSTRPNTLTRYASLRLGPDEEKRVCDAAAQLGLTKSQWLRKVVLQAAGASPETRLVLSELAALRAIVLAFFGTTPGGKEAVLKEAIAHADSIKLARADAVILAYAKRKTDAL